MVLVGFFVVSSFCFFKQKTAYDMRISDWSSDVCSSDLLACWRELVPSMSLWGRRYRRSDRRRFVVPLFSVLDLAPVPDDFTPRDALRNTLDLAPIGRASCRERVCLSV